MPHNPYSKAAKPLGDPPIFGDGIFAWKNNFAGSSCDKTWSQVVQWCQANGVVVVPGVATPTEVAVGWSTRTGTEFASSESFQMFVYIISSHLKSHFDFCQFDLRSLFVWSKNWYINVIHWYSNIIDSSRKRIKELHTVDVSEIPFPTTWDLIETLVNNGRSTTNLPQLVSFFPDW